MSKKYTNFFLWMSIFVLIVIAGIFSVHGWNKSERITFVHVENGQYIDGDGAVFLPKSMALAHWFWDDSAQYQLHHDENTYKELSDLGFNSVRFYLSYRYFEEDDNPYQYKEDAFVWLDQNVEWAKKYNMGIIFNMHVPQGGYQSDGSGITLWTEQENVERLTALWKEIATRYANETTVWGYGLINEPTLSMMASTSDTIECYKEVMTKLAGEVRSVAPHQIIFIETINNIIGENVDYSQFTPENIYPVLEDSNVAYEFHFYTPHELTGAAGTRGGKMVSYPDEKFLSAEYENAWVGKESGQEITAGEWNYFQTQEVMRTEDYNVGIVVINAGNMKNESVCFDDIELIEISEDGTEKILAFYQLDDLAEASEFSSWSSDGTGTMEYCAIEGMAGSGCLKISNASGELVCSAFRFELKEGCSYQVSGYVKKEFEESECFATVRLDYALASRINCLDKAYLQECLLPYIEFAKKHEVPLFMGEYGVCADTFSEDADSAKAWLTDVITLCKTYEIGFNYHAYHEPMYGMYSTYNQLPDKANRNEVLVEIFREMLR